MNQLKSMCVYSVLVLLSFLITESAEAQQRGRGRRAPARREVVVVHRTPRKVVVRKAHVRYATLPRWGTVVTVRPAGAVLVGRRNPYYFYNGIYYAQRGAGYAIVRPHRGIRISALPLGYRTIVVGPRSYFYYYGTFYAQASGNKEYHVIDPPEGAVVDALPDGYHVKNINGTEYYELDGVYYAEVDAPEFEDGVGYEVVKI